MRDDHKKVEDFIIAMSVGGLIALAIFFVALAFI